MEILDQLGMLERFLKRPHNKVRSRRPAARWRNRGRSPTSRIFIPSAPFIAMMPQWEFLDFLREEAKAFPGFNLRDATPVAAFIEEGAGLRASAGRRERGAGAADDCGRRTSLDRPDLAANRGPRRRRSTSSGSVSPSSEAEKRRVCASMIGGGAIIVLIDRGDLLAMRLRDPKGRAPKADRRAGSRRIAQAPWPRRARPRPQRAQEIDRPQVAERSSWTG